ncbi:MAG: hypothetical protein GY841_04750 [FCB group bacterium]|nr:hypothetical protein [FCB group bacterium]
MGAAAVQDKAEDAVRVKVEAVAVRVKVEADEVRVREAEVKEVAAVRVWDAAVGLSAPAVTVFAPIVELLSRINRAFPVWMSTARNVARK